ncbi:MAG: hypothetical protein J6S30_04120 [Kiritimatiellae bacterium]|nr:hypothetical protein [Kiritimatiellia bacterium]
MTRLVLNREFLLRHAFSLAVFLSLGGWFGFDAFYRYPATPAKDLYFSIEKSEAPEGYDLEGFKKQKTQTQCILAALTFLAALGVGLHLLAAWRFDFSYDKEGFVYKGRRFSYTDIKSIDKSRWEKKNILVLLGEGWRITLDGWHHQGVRDFAETIKDSRNADY